MSLQRFIKKVPLRLFLWIYFIISLYPLIYLVFYSLKDNQEIFFTNPFGFPHDIKFGNYVTALKSFKILLYLRNSAIVTLSSCGIAVAFALSFAYAVSRMNWNFGKASYTYILIGMFIPIQVIMIPLAILIKDLHLVGTFWALILPYIAFNLSFSSLIFNGFFRTIPREIEESAYMDGAGVVRTFAQIMVPILRPAIATVFTFAFLNIWNEYPMALVLLSSPTLKTLPVAIISNFVGSFVNEWGPMGAAMVISSIPTVVVYIFLSEQIEKALTVGSSVKG